MVVHPQGRPDISSRALQPAVDRSIPPLFRVGGPEYLLPPAAEDCKIFKFPDAGRDRFYDIVMSVSIRGKRIGNKDIGIRIHFQGNAVGAFTTLRRRSGEG